MKFIDIMENDLKKSKKEVNLFNQLKEHQFVEDDSDFMKILSFSTYVGKNDDIKTFWYCMKLWFNRSQICKILAISNPTFYTLNRSIALDTNMVSEKLLNRLELFYKLLYGYVNE